MDDHDYEKLLAQVVRLERRWLDVYCDPAGNLIVAADPPGEQLSTDRKRMTVLESRLRRVASDLEVILPDVGRIDTVRQRVLIHIAFNIGVEQLRARFISAVQSGLWEAAAHQMMISDWGKHDKRRASVLAEMMRTGRDETGM
jgi:GH24 family phage-related lysozyme (muramidase)